MLVGESGLGKSTFVNTLFLTKIKKHRDNSERTNNILNSNQTVGIEIVRAILEENGFKMRLNIIGTPGFGSNVNNNETWNPIIDFIDEQHELYMKQEQQPIRTEIKDLRVHACIYFIRPTGHSLKPLDIEIMKRLSTRVNLIPVIAKSDTLSPKEIDRFKQRIREIVVVHDIKIYTPPLDGDEKTNEYTKELINAIPFAIVGSEQVHEVSKGVLVKGRKYPWGFVEIENENHCDFVKLRSLILRTHMLDLILSTNDIHFESYRSFKLSTFVLDSGNVDDENNENENNENLVFKSHNFKKPKKFTNPKFKEEEESLKKYFTDQVKVEDDRFRQWETNIVNERHRLNQDLQDLQDKLKSLEEQVKRLQFNKR